MDRWCEPTQQKYSFNGVGGYDVHRSRAGLYNVATTTTWCNNNFGGGEGQPAMRYDAAYTNFINR
jgi:hypothetical protein